MKDELPLPVAGVSILVEQLGAGISADDASARSRRTLRRDAHFDDTRLSSDERPARS
uniref:Uncharacterized protein n=1 Tax=Peronospora matthiolae TaxID=2874970 RepID=A0AAV1U988_9STRA